MDMFTRDKELLPQLDKDLGSSLINSINKCIQAFGRTIIIMDKEN
jgi:hypothetical protein